MTKSNEPDLLEDLKASKLICEKVRDGIYAQNLYAALCNNEFQKIDVFEILRDSSYSVSWRHAGSVIANLRDVGEIYTDFYCSGIPAGDPDIDINSYNRNYRPEGFITDEIMADLKLIGWWPIKNNRDELI